MVRPSHAQIDDGASFYEREMNMTPLKIAIIVVAAILGLAAIWQGFLR